MRIVNRVEREVVQAEWENWLCDEMAKCKAVEKMMAENRTQSLASPAGVQQNLSMEEDHDRFREVRVWLDDYCGSCSREQEQLLGRSMKANAT